MKLTPLHINLMLKYYAQQVPDHPTAPASIAYTQQLEEAGLIQEAGIPCGYISTKKGDAFVSRICKTPLPVKTEVWA